VVLFLLRFGFDAFVIAADAVDRIGKPDRTIRCDNGVIRRVQLLAIVTCRDDGDRAVEFRSGDASAAVFARDQASFAIDGVAVRVHRRLAIHADMTIILRKPHDAVVGNVAEQHVSSGREVDWAFGPAEPGCDTFYRHGACEGWKVGGPERNSWLG